MNKELNVFVFYIILVVIGGLAGWKLSNSEDKMINTFVGVILGAVLSLILWQVYGKKYVKSE